MTEVEEKIAKENRKFWRNIRRKEEAQCERKRNSGMPCSKEICEKYDTSKCIHPELAGFPAKRF